LKTFYVVGKAKNIEELKAALTAKDRSFTIAELRRH
jgi:hypothetical protein